MDLMRRISGQEPRCGTSGRSASTPIAIAYDSGREGDWHALGFYPRKGRMTIYLMDGTARHAEPLAGLGRHTTSRVCVYLKRLGDVDLSVLEQVLRDSYAYLKDNDGDVKRV